MMETIGEIGMVWTKFDIEWKIKNFFSLSRKNAVFYSSSLFPFAGEPWYLQIYPNGESDDETDGYIDLLLCRENSNPPISLNFSFALKTIDGKGMQEKHLTSIFDESSMINGAYKFISRFELLERRNELVPADILTVVCKLKFSSLTTDTNIFGCLRGEFNDVIHITHNLAFLGSEKLSNDLKKIMMSGDHSDTIVRVKGKEFRLHKNILGARNPFFDSMFKSEMKENITGVVSIDDCEPQTFYSFIHFIYTGKFHVSEGNVCNLYVLADKYQENQLKEECLEFMMNSMDIDTFIDFVVLALKHNEKKLLLSATGFFCTRVKQIIRCAEWETFLREYPTQANELYIKATDHFDDKLNFIL